ncbi:two-component sensor histidine kinase [Sphingomonas sp. DBB INV C78]|uniref:sensor histidine kinase n=1 Tax=Sphingomonas sp. DBB INV C78 TaxID=3349434 RepID=UPI0036D402AE
MISQGAAAIIAGLAAAWLALAGWATIVGLRRAAAASIAEAQCDRFAELVGAAPAVAVLVEADGRIDADERLADWLGLSRLPRSIEEFSDRDGGLIEEDAQALARDVVATQRSGASFARPFRVRGSPRVLMARGRPASRPGRVVLWLFDATDSQEEIGRLRDGAGRLTRALDSLSALIEAAPFPMWHRGPDLRLALVNTNYVDAVEGDDAADVIARGLELVEATDGIGPMAAAAAARDGGEPLVRTVPATIAGERRMVRIVDVPLGEAGVAGYAFDVGELEEARADLGRFVRAQRVLLDHLSAGVAQFGPDRHLAFCNQPFQRMFAMEPEWLADRPEFDRVLERMREANRAPESRDFPGWKRERRGWFQDAGEAVEESWLLPGGAHLRVLAQPMPDGGLLVIFEDRTEQIQLASARDTLLRVRSATFDNLFEAIGVFAADGRLHLWNNRFKEVWGLSETDLARNPRVDALVETVKKRLVNPSRAGLIRDLVRIATVDRQQRSGNVAFADGRNFEFAAVPLPDGNALFTMLDVTDSRRIERMLRDRNEALEESDRLKTAFVASMSYELRTPLTTIGGFAEMLAGGYAGKLESTGQDYVGAILESVARLGALIDDVLDMTDFEAGGLALEGEPVELIALLQDAAHGIADAARARPLELVVQVEAAVGAVPGDKRRLRQAVDHLLRNAILYTPAGGRVLLQGGGDEQNARIVVSDNGEGIAAEDRDRIFHRFHRAPGAGDGDGRPAVGLGLPLTRQFVQAHGGTLELMSEPGEGTTFVITLPRAP